MQHARRRDLQAASAVETVASIEQRMNWLRLIVSADPNELGGIVVKSCPECWPVAVLAARMSEALTEGGDIPDADEPRADCDACLGAGISTTTLTPTGRLSAAGRALIKGTRRTRYGIEYETHDQLAAADLLNRMQAVYVSKHVSVSATMNVPNARDASDPNTALRLFEMFSNEGPRPLVAQVFDSEPPPPAPRVIEQPAKRAAAAVTPPKPATMCNACFGTGEVESQPCGRCEGAGVVRG